MLDELHSKKTMDLYMRFSVSLCLKGPIEMPFLPSENTTVPNVAKPLQRVTGYLLFCKFVDRDHACTELSVSPDKQLCERYNAKLQFLTPYRRVFVNNAYENIEFIFSFESHEKVTYHIKFDYFDRERRKDKGTIKSTFGPYSNEKSFTYRGNIHRFTNLNECFLFYALIEKIIN
uniref:Uncharacterized protein n=1 Tax=Glossina palpalis gambiensis TaxID=67801 RepID=A0A1B0BRB6_9MUSC